MYCIAVLYCTVQCSCRSLLWIFYFSGHRNQKCSLVDNVQRNRGAKGSGHRIIHSMRCSKFHDEQPIPFRSNVAWKIPHGSLCLSLLRCGVWHIMQPRIFRLFIGASISSKRSLQACMYYYATLNPTRLTTIVANFQS